MQTFMPYSNINESVKCLDYKRLGKQRVEAFQILCALDDPWANNERIKRGLKITKSHWAKHPAVEMWRGYEKYLALYMNSCILEWKLTRGFKNTMNISPRLDAEKPWWFGLEIFHQSHRDALIAKEPTHYRKFEWEVNLDGYAYVWPGGKLMNGKYTIGNFVSR